MEASEALALGLTAVLLGLAVLLAFTFCLAEVLVGELVDAGREVAVAGLLAVAGLTSRPEADEEFAGFAAELVVAGLLVVEGLTARPVEDEVFDGLVAGLVVVGRETEVEVEGLLLPEGIAVAE